jgi:drug/metabolite transporter (DMT)-like permease
VTRRAWALFALLSTVWGVPYLFIKLAVEDLSPAWVAFGRVALGFLLLLPWALRRGAFAQLRGRRLGWLVLYAIAEIAIPWPLIGWGEQRIASSLTAILIASLPLLIAVLAIRIDPAERASGVRLVGLVVGFAGVVLLLGLDVAGRPGELLGAGAVLLATCGYAIGPMLIKHRLSDVDPAGPICGSLGISTIALAPLAALSVPDHAPGLKAVGSVVVLAVVCSVIAFLALFALIAEIGPGRTSVITYVNPAVALLLGVTLLGESLRPTAVAGLLLILAGSWLSTGGRVPPGGPVVRAALARRRRPGLLS